MPQLDLYLVWPIVLSIALAYGIAKLRKVGSRDQHLPPGPTTFPLLGNITSLPLKDAYIKFTEWSKAYGGLYSLKIGPQTVIVVSAVDAVHEILEKNGGITASRPKMEPIRRFSSPSGMVAFTPHGPRWRKLRKAAAELIKPSARLEHRPIRMAEVGQLLFDIHENPQDIFFHIEACPFLSSSNQLHDHEYPSGYQRASVSSLFSIVGGLRVPQTTTSLCKRFFHLLEMVLTVMEPGNAPPVEVFPIFNYIPDVFVGNWKARCATVDRLMKQMLNEMVDVAAKRLKEDRPNGCYLETMMLNAQAWDLDRDDIMGVTAGLVFAGTSTTVSFIQTLVFLAAAYPETVRKVHEELDLVVGADRVPSLDDIPNLPQLNALIREVHRFRTTLPLSIPHFAQEDQFYQDKLIPKGATIFLNMWATLHDPELYDNPDSFDPDRFIRSPYGTKPGVEENVNVEALKRLETLPFGIGRRRCVGLPLAAEAAALTSANLFWAFKFSHPVDNNGVPVEPSLSAIKSGFTNDPLPFRCTVHTRSPRAARIIKHNYIGSTAIFERFERELSKEDREYVEGVRARLRE